MCISLLPHLKCVFHIHYETTRVCTVRSINLDIVASLLKHYVLEQSGTIKYSSTGQHPVKMAEGTILSSPMGSLNLDTNISDNVLDDESDFHRVDDDILDYLLTEIPPKRRKIAKRVVDFYKDGNKG